MTVHVVAHAQWRAETGPLQGPVTRALRSRFGRMLAHGLHAVGGGAGSSIPWIVGTLHGARANLLQALDGNPGEDAHDTAQLVQQVAELAGHRGVLLPVRAGPRTIAMALHLARARLMTDEEAIVVLAEDAAAPPLTARPYDGVLVALRLSRTPTPRARVLVGPTRRSGAVAGPPSDPLADNPLWPAFALVDALRRPGPSELPLFTADQRGAPWWVSVT